jgi:hypothetical protein
MLFPGKLVLTQSRHSRNTSHYPWAVRLQSHRYCQNHRYRSRRCWRMCFYEGQYIGFQKNTIESTYSAWPLLVQFSCSNVFGWAEPPWSLFQSDMMEVYRQLESKRDCYYMWAEMKWMFSNDKCRRERSNKGSLASEREKITLETDANSKQLKTCPEMRSRTRKSSRRVLWNVK